MLASYDLSMAVREFVDSNGVTWRVWNTRPSRGEMLSGEYGHGWLTFESGTTVRRCTQIPPGWETAPAQLLESLCLGSPETRRTPGGGTRITQDDSAEDRF